MKVHQAHTMQNGLTRKGLGVQTNPVFYWTCSCGKGHVSTEIDTPPNIEYLCRECHTHFAKKDTSH